MNEATAHQETGSLLSDEEIVGRICAGDSALFEILMRRHNQRVYRAVTAIAGAQQAEDVMQQAYMNAYRSLRGFEGRAKFSTWLVRIAVNEAIAQRTRQRAHEVDLNEELYDQFLEQVRSELPDPEEEAMAEEMKKTLEAVVLALPESYRTVVMLREVEGMSTAETAQCLDVSEDVVKTRLHRARSMMKEELFARTGTSVQGLFRFLDPRCNVVVEAVMKRIASEV